MEKKKFKTGKILLWICVVILAVIAVQVGRSFFFKQEWQARQSLHHWIQESFPEAQQKIWSQYGLALYEPSAQNQGGQDVILVHGLDEPGRIWRNLKPELADRGFKVWLMSYPNDQAIADSARFFFKVLAEHQFDPKQPVAIVAHSMGGLVSRQMLTDPTIDYEGAVAAGICPGVSKLIMAGTPNHGAELARFRFVMEIRDQINNLISKDALWYQGLMDGTGAAGIDLIPGSDFLIRLNMRPHPEHVQMALIAGTLSPWSAPEVDALFAALEQRLPKEAHDRIHEFETAFESTLGSLGDGLVPLSSVALEGVPLTQVEGNHLTMLRNITPASTRIPPAVPLIVKMLSP